MKWFFFIFFLSTATQVRADPELVLENFPDYLFEKQGMTQVAGRSRLAKNVLRAVYVGPKFSPSESMALTAIAEFQPVGDNEGTLYRSTFHEISVRRQGNRLTIRYIGYASKPLRALMPHMIELKPAERGESGEAFLGRLTGLPDCGSGLSGLNPISPN